MHSIKSLFGLLAFDQSNVNMTHWLIFYVGDVITGQLPVTNIPLLSEEEAKSPLNQ